MKNKILSKQNIRTTSIPSGAIKDLSFNAIGLYAYMMSKPDGYEGNFDAIADEKQMRKSAVKKAFAELQVKGWFV